MKMKPKLLLLLFSFVTLLSIAGCRPLSTIMEGHGITTAQIRPAPEVAQAMVQVDENGHESVCPPVLPGTRALQNEAQGICLLYPDTFDIFYGTEGSLTLYEESLLNTEAPLASIYVESANGRSLAEVTDERLADYAFPGTEPKEATLGGQPAMLLDNLPGQDTNRRIVTVHGDQVYDLIVARIGADYGAVGEEAEALYELLVNSWQFRAPR